MRTMPSPWKTVLTAKAVSTVIVLVVLGAAAMNLEQFRSAYAQWPEGKSPTLESRFATWDIAHYLKLSQKGYKPGSHSCAFYPLWPAVLKVGTALTGGHPVTAAMLLANGLSLVGFWMFYQLVRHRQGENVARDTLILMLACPGALFFTFPYTESMYFVLLMLFFWGLEKGRWTWAAVAGFLLPLGRPVGVFIVLPLAWHLYERWRPTKAGAVAPVQASAPVPALCVAGGGAGGPSLPPAATAKPTVSGAPEAHSVDAAQLTRWSLLLAFPLLGYAAYFALMHTWTGNAFEGFQAQRFYPNSPSIKNMFNVAGFTHALMNVSSLDGMMDSVLDRGFFILLLLLLPLIYRLDLTWFWYVLPAGVVPALTSWFMSYRRYFMVLFPAFVVLALLLQRVKSRALFWYYVAILAAIQAWAIKQFMTFRWAG